MVACGRGVSHLVLIRGRKVAHVMLCIYVAEEKV